MRTGCAYTATGESYELASRPLSKVTVEANKTNFTKYGGQVSSMPSGGGDDQLVTAIERVVQQGIKWRNDNGGTTIDQGSRKWEQDAFLGSRAHNHKQSLLGDRLQPDLLLAQTLGIKRV
jgi:hypothetical protein